MTNDTRWFDLVGAYVLDALDPGERSAFEERLASDRVLRADVDAHREAIAALTGAAPRLSPPPELKQKIMAAAAASPPSSRSAAAGRARPMADSPVTPVQPSTPGAPPQGRFGQWLLIAAAVVVALGLGVVAQRIEQRRATLATQLAETEARLDSAATQLAAKDSLLATFLGPDIVTAVLSATDQAPSARIFWNRATSTILVTAFNLPPAPEGRTYQLWGITDPTNPVSLGTFQTAADGTAVVQRAAPPGMTFDIGAITEEPAGGSAQPTTTPFLLGSWAGA